jgi:hypothetical protein
MREQGIDEGAVDIPGPRMHDETRGLIDDDEGRILIDHIEGDRLRFRLRAHRRRQSDSEAVTRFDRVIHVLYGRGPERHAALADQGLEARAAQLREAGAQEAIEPKPGMARIGACSQGPGRIFHEEL